MLGLRPGQHHSDAQMDGATHLVSGTKQDASSIFPARLPTTVEDLLRASFARYLGAA